ncbi:hypothetical protein DYQ86_17665 [Acidobacteria bacterium AB60]|nr:hypothetical protein DYQ86_17665 [Acidobacteria bacterium AB60]
MKHLSALQIRSRILRLAVVSLLVALTLAAGQGYAQKPPSANPNMSIPDMYVLHTKDWPTGPTASLPQPYLTRTNAGERWFNIEIARGTFCDGWEANGQFDPNHCENASTGYTYTHLGNLRDIAGSSSPGWISAASANGGAGYPSALMYTFNTVPEWASSSTASSASTPNPPTDVVSTNGVYTQETCSNVLTGYTTPKGDCYFKEFVTYLMRSLCHISHQPSTPLVNTCDIRYFEGWNEFNSDQFWTGKYTQLAQMMADADEIIHLYCGDCYFMAGSVSAGGDGWHANGETGVYANALGELLDAWHSYDANRPPDMLSFHAYPSHDDIFPVPMPETNVAAAGFKVPSGMKDATTQAGCTAPSPAPVYPEASTGLACRDAVVNMIPEMKLVPAHEGAWLVAGIPIWNTESGWGVNGGLDFGIATNSVDPATDNSLTDTQRQAYIARASILLASSGDALNLWYQLDNATWGTLATYDSSGNPTNTPAATTFNRVYGWLLGAKFNSSPGCSGSNSVWSCSITKKDGTKGLLVWYATTDKDTTFTMPSGLTYIHDMDGNTLGRSPGQTLRLFNRPALLDTYSGSE